MRTPQDTGALWREAELMVNKNGGALVLDDTTLDKPYSQKIALVTNHWSGKHHAVVRAINIITLLWTDGEKLVPTDFRAYDKPFGGKTKNEHFVDMLLEARRRGISPEYVIFDSWYSSLDNLKMSGEVGSFDKGIFKRWKNFSVIPILTSELAMFLRMPHAETSVQDRIEYRPSVLEPQAVGDNRADHFIELYQVPTVLSSLVVL